ncbi:unnamed protein product [Dracunculus medinensis]|uniref:SAM domain-containing protein n=1 Tax=Dracunculus medinensis TaxID=318479 RepID=A0A3P7PVM2_DRAME|nr:unnamed protein product [Dracunculus medinensis]
MIILLSSLFIRIFYVIITADEEKLRDYDGYSAIVQLHYEMDDDKSGSIDRIESTGFLKEDMHIGGDDRVTREKAFHHNNDELITVDDLWKSWVESEERSWTTQQMVNWMEHTVRLPQYSAILNSLSVNGRALPRMALMNSTYLSYDLKVKNSAHKRKIRLKALDVVLFAEKSSQLKDIALSILLVVLAIVLVIFNKHRARSKYEVDQLTSKLSQLKIMKSDFEDTQQRTCEFELNYIGQLRMDCLAEMREAIEHIDKLRKKQSSLVSSIKLATGASTGTDQIDSKIFSLKGRMEKISLAMSESYQRWIEIESLCGFPLFINAVSNDPLSNG